MTLEDKVHAFRLRLFRRAEELGNISAACREAGISRSLYYQLRGRFERYGSDGLHPKHRQGRPGRPPLLDAQVERRILAEALAQPGWGPQRISDQLAMRGIHVAASTVYRALRRHHLGTRRRRMGIRFRGTRGRARGSVVRVQKPSWLSVGGVGVRFESMNKELAAALDEFLAESDGPDDESTTHDPGLLFG